MKRVLLQHEHVHLEARFEMDQVERRSAPDRVGHAVCIDMEAILERCDERK